MEPVEINGVEGMKALMGETIGPSDWREVTQEDINGSPISPATTSGSTPISSAPRRSLRSAPRSPTAT
jgi:hypothetical protein